MMWVSLIVVLSLLSIGFISFLIALFFYERPVATSLLGGIDLLLGLLLRQVYGHFFPSQPRSNAHPTPP
jgi:hypothetical protein